MERDLRKDLKREIQLIYYKSSAEVFSGKSMAICSPCEHVEGKVIVLHFVPLAPWCNRLKQHVDTLVDICNAIHSKCPFEIVFIRFEVPKPQRSLEEYTKSSYDYLEEMLSIMPSNAAIPFPLSYLKSLKIIIGQRRLKYLMYLSGYYADSSTFSLVIDPAGVVLQLGDDTIFHAFGVVAYPFSDKRVSYLEHQDQTALDYPSITQLLTSPGHEHVITKDYKEVPVKDLEDKTVALYIYEDSHISFDWFTKKLNAAYHELSPAKKDKFEVVLVYIDDSIDALRYASEESFRDALHGMPWLALPFKHPKCKNLHRIFEYSPLNLFGPDPKLVIIGPRGNFVEPSGADIVKHFGAKAYPFTRKEAVKLEVDYIKTLKLDMFLDPNTSFGETRSKVKLSQLAGKKIILIVEVGAYNERPKFWNILTKRYKLMKDMGDPFEVIYVPYKDTSE